jgi:hypothetical protein
MVGFWGRRSNVVASSCVNACALVVTSDRIMVL